MTEEDWGQRAKELIEIFSDDKISDKIDKIMCQGCQRIIFVDAQKCVQTSNVVLQSTHLINQAKLIMAAKQVVYKGLVLMKGSTALELWDAWQKETKDRNSAQKKLDVHMKDVETRHKELLERYK